MTELIRRANSHANSPFAAPTARRSPLTRPVYSPLLKSSRRSLSLIAPLHPNRKTPPPPLPPLPPKKKSKKEQELEEQWEEEIIEDIGGISEWLALSEGEKNNLKRSKRDREMGFCEDWWTEVDLTSVCSHRVLRRNVGAFPWWIVNHVLCPFDLPCILQ